MNNEVLQVKRSFIFTVGIVVFGLAFFVVPLKADPVHAQPITPTFGVIAPCPSCANPSEAPGETTPRPSGTGGSPTGVVISAAPTAATNPCESGTTSITASKKHKKGHGGISGFMERFIKFLIELINKILQMLGGGQIPVPGQPSTGNPIPTKNPEPTTANPNPNPTTGNPEPTTNPCAPTPIPGAPTTPPQSPNPIPTGQTGIAPTTPPAQICGNTSLLSGSSTPPAGAITVPAGDNSTFSFGQANKTFWFAPGIHTLGSGQYSQIIPGENSTYIGAPGAVIDGKSINNYAFTQTAKNVRIAYLEIRNFVSPRDQGVVNHDSGTGWVMEYNWIHHNKGAGVFAATNNILRYNCLADNGQYGFQAFSANNEIGPSNVTIDHNEVARNNTDDWEHVSNGCGCTGGAKFWLANNVTVTNNWVHDNLSTGLWFDNNNRNSVVENNLIENNWSEGLFIEAGYDVAVRSNTLRNNAWGKGREFQARSDVFPIAAIYVSDNGSPTGYGLKTSPMVISNNLLENNWGGVALWENADRYSGSSAHTHISGTIKIGDLVSDAKCKSGTPNDIPNNLDKYLCRWSTENIIIENNDFRINKATIGQGCVGANYCGISGIFANFGTYPEFPGYEIPWRLTFQQKNIFRNNKYVGDWKFAGFQTAKPDGTRVTWAEWTAPAPTIPTTFTHDNRPTTFGQDQGSTLQ